MGIGGSSHPSISLSNVSFSLMAIVTTLGREVHSLVAYTQERNEDTSRPRGGAIIADFTFRPIEGMHHMPLSATQAIICHSSARWQTPPEAGIKSGGNEISGAPSGVVPVGISNSFEVV